MTTGRITAANAPGIAAIRLGITEGDAQGRIEAAWLTPVRDGMRHWYDRAEFDAWLTRQPEFKARGRAVVTDAPLAPVRPVSQAERAYGPPGDRRLALPEEGSPS